ncbi:MAG: dUTP diphosphatase [Actinobacteria bacterium]|jgi:dUTP pyrophosphatase|nr:dUTP diphosphatase [Actinomycetota bacterium]NCV43602.1 dUTP diphosphatase [Actinomycetota bacterium]NCV83827.1 dUTP diphosphatase [Actinomycetota bacterium]NCW46534.1 dUTP diphosphatase [Actinomycetota bacterium]NCW96364.1 dUTP diphosphatase [Actinomycetota bacterium]
MKILVTRLDPNLPLPTYAKPGDAGADLYSRIDIELSPMQRALVPTGLAIALPPGYAGFLHPRSGRAAKEGLSMVNAPGTIDAGYRGEIQVILINLDSEKKITIKRGERIAQLVIKEVSQAEFVEVEQLPGTSRGEAGFGSSGKS